MRCRDNPEVIKPLLSLATRLKSLRVDQVLTITELAAASGISVQTIQKFEDYGQPVNFTALHATANVLGHDLELRLKRRKE